MGDQVERSGEDRRGVFSQKAREIIGGFEERRDRREPARSPEGQDASIESVAELMLRWRDGVYMAGRNDTDIPDAADVFAEMRRVVVRTSVEAPSETVGYVLAAHYEDQDYWRLVHRRHVAAGQTPFLSRHEALSLVPGDDDGITYYVLPVSRATPTGDTP